MTGGPRRSSRRVGVGSFLLLLATGCTLAPAPDGAAVPADPEDLPPPGHGTLRQEEISLVLRSPELEIMVTPLAESFIRVTAPDTWERLSGIARRHRPSAPESSLLFLVSFFTRQPEVRFTPEEVQLLSRGLRLRPSAIFPVTPTWGQHRVRQRSTEMAVYAFPPEVDLESELLLAYGLQETGGWEATLGRVQAERARARARAGVGTSRSGGAQTSRSYFEIFR